jgi:hypothetical protein
LSCSFIDHFVLSRAYPFEACWGSRLVLGFRYYGVSVQARGSLSSGSQPRLGSPILWRIDCHWESKKEAKKKSSPMIPRLDLLTHCAVLGSSHCLGPSYSLPPMPPVPVLLQIMKKLGPHPAGAGRGPIVPAESGKSSTMPL